jgi:hypothetical protein
MRFRHRRNVGLDIRGTDELLRTALGRDWVESSFLILIHSD